MKYTNNMSFPGFEQKLEINLTGTVTWQPDPIGSAQEIPGSIAYLPVDGSMTWEEHGSFTAGDAQCTYSGGGTYPIREPEHHRFYASLDVATNPVTGISHYHGVGLEPPGSELGDVKLTCNPSGVDFPPNEEALAGYWLLTGSTEDLLSGGQASEPSGRLTGTYTLDSSNQGTGIHTWTWDFQPF